jgi:hypothetical protein
MSEPSSSLRAHSPVAPIDGTDGLSRAGEVDHPCDLRGCPFLVGKGSREGAVPRAAIAARGGRPCVPRARDSLRRPAPLPKLLSLP